MTDGPQCPVDIASALSWHCLACGRGRGRGDPPFYPEAVPGEVSDLWPRPYRPAASAAGGRTDAATR